MRIKPQKANEGRGGGGTPIDLLRHLWQKAHGVKGGAHLSSAVTHARVSTDHDGMRVKPLVR